MSIEENTPWKAVYWGVIFSLVVLGLIYFFVSPRDSTYFSEKKEEKAAEFKTSRFLGRKEGKTAWEFSAQSGWVSSDQETSHLNNISKGIIYKNEKPVIKNVFAPRVSVFRNTDIIEAFGYADDKQNGPSKFTALINLGRISKDKDSAWSRIITDYLKYIPDQKKSELAGKVKLIKNDSSFFAPKINVNHENRVAFMPERTLLVRKDLRIEADNMEYLSDKEKIIANGNIRMVLREGKSKTLISCNHTEFNTSMKEEMLLVGSVEVVQDKKLVMGDEGIYSHSKKELVLRNRVKAVFEKARVFLRENTIKKLRDLEARSLLKEKTLLTCDEMLFSLNTSNTHAYGNVKISQKQQEAKADQAAYDNETEDITLSGNASMKKKDKWVNARQIVVSVNDETFQARGSVEAEFKI